MELDTSDGRKKYLSEKLDNLMEGINDSYGKMLLEELISRLEATIKDFNDEVKILCDQLVKKQVERQQLMDMLTSDKSDDFKMIDIDKNNLPESKTKIDNDDQQNHIPAWEQKLSKLEKK